MNPNDASIRRIYTRKQAGTVVDQTLVVTDPNDLVIEWEAGATINSLAVNLTLVVATRNVVTNAIEPAPLTQTISVTTDGTPNETGYTQVINIPANTLAADTVYESIGVLVRGPSQIHSFSNWWLFLGI